MKFELTEALIDEIAFFMEDQSGIFFVDKVKGNVISEDNLDDDEQSIDDDDGEGGERYISLPDWDSSDGFRLMEHFAAEFRNPLIREQLTQALDRGRGVFRAFKDILGSYPEAEKLWFSYKEKEMRREIISWYNSLREEWGLEKIGEEPEDTADLVLEDFRFRPYVKDDMANAEELHRLCQEEYEKILEDAGFKNSAKNLVRESQAFHNLPNNLFNQQSAHTPVTAFIAETGGNEFAGFISGVTKDSVFHIQSLELKPEYRGLGLGEILLGKLIESLDPDEVSQVLVDIPSMVEGFSRVLLRESFKPYAVRYSLDLRRD